MLVAQGADQATVAGKSAASASIHAPLANVCQTHRGLRLYCQIVQRVSNLGSVLPAACNGLRLLFGPFVKDVTPSLPVLLYLCLDVVVDGEGACGREGGGTS